MHKLEQLIAEWRESMRTAPGVGGETLDELENHLRETTDQLVQSGMTDVEAFRSAVSQLGSPPAIASEFQKLKQPTWLPIKVAMGLGCMAAIASATALAAKGSSLLLASHVFTVTLGYTTTFLLGALGICFVCQRGFSNFSRARLQSLKRISFLFSSLAAGLTAVGIILAMVWAKAEWGRFWAWDPKEIGALCTLVWLMLSVAVHWWRGTTARGVLLLSIVGNVVVSLAWFEANRLYDPHKYGMSNNLMLAVVTASSLAFFLVGLAPAGCLRSGKGSAN